MDSSLNQPTYLLVTNQGIENNYVTVTTGGIGSVDVYLDYKNSSESIQKKLSSPILINEDEALFYNIMLWEVPIPNEFINAIFVQYVLNDKPEDKCDPKVVALKTVQSHSMYIREFVTLPNTENMLFVVDFDLTDLTLVCVEVHPSKPIAYGLVKVLVNQVLPTVWAGQVIDNDCLRYLIEDV